MEADKESRHLNLLSTYQELSSKHSSRSSTVQLYRLLRCLDPWAVDLRTNILETISTGFDSQREEFVEKIRTENRGFTVREENKYVELVFAAAAAGRYQSLGSLEKEARAVRRQGRETLRKIDIAFTR